MTNLPASRGCYINLVTQEKWYAKKSGKITPMTSITISVGEQPLELGGNNSRTQVVIKEKQGGNISDMLMTGFHARIFKNYQS